MGKAKPASHTAAELAKKAKDATVNRGGGNKGIEDRKGGVAGHAKFQCPSCGQAVPDMKTGQAHWESKHSKQPFVPEDWKDKHAEVGGVTTQGTFVVGSKKVKHK